MAFLDWPSQDPSNRRFTLIALSVFFCYAFADGLARVLGDTGMTVIVRLSSFLLLCIGVQIVWNGVSALLTSVSFRVH